MDFDKPPDMMTLVLMGLGVFVLFLCCCCTTAPMYMMYQDGGLLKKLKR